MFSNSTLAPPPPEICFSCVQYDLKLQMANDKIANLQKKLQELKVAYRHVLQQQHNSTAIKTIKTKCRICCKESKLSEHLCLDQSYISCDLCGVRFVTTRNFLDHLNIHADEINEKKKFYKCSLCSLGYPMQILLKCHKLSHGKEIEPPAPNNVSNGTDKIDDIPENTDSIMLDDLPKIIQPTLSYSTSTASQSSEMANKCKKFHFSRKTSRSFINNTYCY